MGWSIREKETYAIVLALKKFRSWLASSQIKILVRTDHQSLESWYNEDLNNMIGSVGRRGRWHEFLSQFNLEIVYVPGESQVVADALSRWAYPAGIDSQDSNFHGDANAARYASLCDRQELVLDGLEDNPGTLKTVMTDQWSYSLSSWRTMYDSVCAWNDELGYTITGDKLFLHNRLCVPQDKQNEVLEFYHSFGHPGGSKLFFHCQPEMFV